MQEAGGGGKFKKNLANKTPKAVNEVKKGLQSAAKRRVMEFGTDAPAPTPGGKKPTFKNLPGTPYKAGKKTHSGLFNPKAKLDASRVKVVKNS